MEVPTLAALRAVLGQWGHSQQWSTTHHESLLLQALAAYWAEAGQLAAVTFWLLVWKHPCETECVCGHNGSLRGSVCAGKQAAVPRG